MLVVCTGEEAKDGELLFGELGPIVRTIQNRLSQKKFEKTSLFPIYYKQSFLHSPSICANPTLLNLVGSGRLSLGRDMDISCRPDSTSLVS